MKVDTTVYNAAKEYGLKMRIEFDEDRLIQKFGRNTYNAQKKLDAQIVKDCNIYVPMETSMLQKSAILSTVIGSGLVVWNTPYAKAQYYGVNFDHSKSPNPNACAKWFEVAKAKRLEVWRKLVNDEYLKNT